jgi:beta-fructofuranosidase
MKIKNGWLNDPNGFIKIGNTYHLYFQHLPHSNIWNLGIGWGHATSKDLKIWKIYKNRSLTPSTEYDKDGCFSGSIIKVNDKLYAFYTGVSMKGDKLIESQCLAYSTNGTNFVKIIEPIIKTPPVPHTYCWRDPFIFKYNNIYYILIGSGWSNKGRILLYEGDKCFPCQKWIYKGVIMSVPKDIILECPFITQINDDMWILGASCNNKKPVYWLGKFDGEKFILDNKKSKKYKILKTKEEHNIYAPTIVKINNESYFWAWIRDTNELYGPCKIQYNPTKKTLEPLRKTIIE